MAGDACLTFERGNARDLATKLTTLAADPQQRQYLSARTDEELAKFAPDRIIERYETDFTGLIDARS